MHTCVWFCFLIRIVDTWKNFLNSVSPVGISVNSRTICLSLLGVQQTKDGSSLSIVRKSCLIAVIGLNFVGTVGVGEKARSMRSKSRLTKLFVTGLAGGVEGVVCTWLLTWEGAAAAGCTMVVRGGSVIDPRRLM